MFQPKLEEQYWYISIDSGREILVDWTTNENRYEDTERERLGNMFQDEFTAQSVAQKFREILKEASK